MNLASLLKHKLVVQYAPAALRLGVYVAVIAGSAVIFTSTIGVLGTQFAAVAEQAIGEQPKRPLPRSDVPNPKVIAPPSVAPQGGSATEVHSVFNSIAELTAPVSNTEVMLDPSTTATITELEPPAATGDFRIISDVTIRATPENHGKPLGTIAAGEYITATATENGWVQIAQNGNVLGWIYQRFIEPAT